MSGVYDGLTVVELADRTQPVGGQASGRRRRAGDPGRAARGQSGTVVRPLRRRQGRSRPLPRLLVVQHRQAERRPRHRPPAGAGPAPATAGPGRHLPRKHGAGNARVRTASTTRPCPSNRALIYASLTDFGQDGPWRDHQMNDAAHLALGGHMASSGYSDPSRDADRRAGAPGVAHGLRLRAPRDHAGPLRPDDDRRGPVHRRLDPRRLLDRHRVGGARVAVQRRDALPADGHARGGAAPAGSRVAHGRRHVRDRGEPDLRRSGLGASWSSGWRRRAWPAS